ncbi:MAG: hypothetical protein Q7U36_00565 [bacterium]|nr:hypothetical protein [bacterium]
MNKNMIDDNLKLIIESVSDEKFNETISKGALKLNDNQIQTVSFIFWLCYMAENDLNDVLKQAWQLSTEITNPEISESDQKILLKTFSKKDNFDINNLEYFADKIKIHEAMCDDNLTKLLWKLNELRNDISHNRINKLGYNGQSLFLREIKEKILFDYFELFEHYKPIKL